MVVVWKYILDQFYNEIEIPASARVMCVQMQGDKLCLWCLCKPNNPLVKRVFRIVGTGVDLPVYGPELEYIGTVQNNELVWHVFEDVSQSWRKK